jgi:hypothetical protein
MSFSRWSVNGYVTAAPMSRWHEPTLKELLSEPIIRALMDADGVDPEDLEAMLRWTALRIHEEN